MDLLRNRRCAAWYFTALILSSCCPVPDGTGKVLKLTGTGTVTGTVTGTETGTVTVTGTGTGTVTVTGTGIFSFHFSTA